MAQPKEVKLSSVLGNNEDILILTLGGLYEYCDGRVLILGGLNSVMNHAVEH
jgi:hypothetical protein